MEIATAKAGATTRTGLPHTCMCARANTCVHKHTHVQTHTCKHTHANTHTNTYTQPLTWTYDIKSLAHRNQ